MGAGYHHVRWRLKGGFAMQGILSITKENANLLNERQQKPALLFFYSPVCRQCGRIHPYLDELASSKSGALTFGKVDITADADLAVDKEVLTIPTILLLKEGSEAGRLSGNITRQKILDLLALAGEVR
jgi:thioredoxin 1